MTGFTYVGTPQAEHAVDRDLMFVVQALKRCHFAKKIEALILMGGFGRGEGLCLGNRPYNDYDFIVVGDPKLQTEVLSLSKKLTECLRIPVDMWVHKRESLARAEFSLMNAELKAGHRVLMGPANILDCMPNMPLDEIPMTEGLRLLINRGSLLLHVKTCFRHFRERDFEENRVFKFLIKCHLAMGDAELIRLGRYDLSYENKAEKLGETSRLANYYREAVNFKLRGKLPSWTESEALEWTYTYYPKYLAKYLESCPKQYSWLNPLRHFRVFPWTVRLGLFEHPRIELAKALKCLLGPNINRELAAKLLVDSSDHSEVEEHFFHLWERLA